MSAPVHYPRPEVLERLRGEGGALPRLAVLEASAGTGKTFTIEHACADLVLGGIPIEALLVVTFTERAAAELRERVRALLTRLLAADATPAGTDPARAWRLDDAARDRLRAALRDFDRAPISTIHGFCQRVLTENAFLLGERLAQQVVDPRGAFGDAFAAALRRDLARAPLDTELAAWLGARELSALEELLREVDRQRAEVRPPLDAPALEAAAARLRALCRDAQALGRLRAAVANPAVRVNAKTRQAIQDRIDVLARLGERWTAPPSLLALHVDKEVLRLEYLAQDNPQAALARLGGPAIDELRDALGALRAARANYEAAAAQLFLPAVRSRLAEAKAREGTYDFGDMLTRVEAALASGAPAAERLLARLRARYRHALIDEFQDTDEVQWAIFRRLFLEGPDPGLWVVGDPKQAIYGFRGGDVFAYLRARDQLAAAGAPREPLRRSYRSTPALLAALHHLFAAPVQGAAELGLGEGIAYDPEVEAGRPGLTLLDAAGDSPAPIKVARLTAPAGEPFKAGAARALQAAWIAREVRAIRDRGLWLDDGRERRRVPLGQVLVLTRSAAEGRAVGAALGAAGVRHAYYRQDGLLQTAEADDVLRLLLAIEAPGDRARRLAAWATPFFGVPLGELAAARELPGDHPLQAWLFAWRRLAEARRYERLFAEVLDRTGLVRRQVLLAESERELTNYLHLFELLVDAVGASRVDLGELIALLRDWIAKRRRPVGEDGDVQRLESDADAVQILTLHKAKGLEADCVFVFGGITRRREETVFLYHEPPAREAVIRALVDREGLSRDEAYRRWREQDERHAADERDLGDQARFVYHDPAGQRVLQVGKPSPEVRARIRREREDEERRLFYVGATRARARLYLPTFARDAKGEWSYGRLGGCALHPAARLDDLAARDALPADLFEVEELSAAAAPTPPPPADLTRLAGWSPPLEVLTAADDAAAWTAVLRGAPEHTARVVTSFTQLHAQEAARRAADELRVEGRGGDEAEVEATSPDATDPAAAPAASASGGLPPGANTGSFVHAVLEEVCFASLGDAEALAVEAWAALPQVAEVFERCARRYGVAPALLPAAHRLVHGTLTAPLDLPSGPLERGLRAVASPRPEVEFTFPLPEAAAHRLHLPPGAVVGRGYVRGFMDLVFRHPGDGRAYVLDWKTNTLDDYDPQGGVAAEVERTYRTQLELYTLALVRLLGARDESSYQQRFGGAVYAFARGMGPDLPRGSGVLVARPSWDELLGWEERLARLEVSW